MLAQLRRYCAWIGGSVYFHRCSHCRMHIVALAAAAALASCGGGGSGGADPAPSNPLANASRPVVQSDLQIAQSIYAGDERTPEGFYSDAPLAGREHVSTFHLKNADIDPAAVAPQPLYELCTNDWNEALAWSEAGARSAPQYSDLVETNDDERFFEFGRVRAGEPQLYLRARVFKCAYLDRTSANLRLSGGPAGQLNRRPPTAADLQQLSEYLWLFTTYNNFGHVVLKSSGASTSGGLTHTLYMGSLVAKGISDTCDRIDVISWLHTVDENGQLQLDAETLWSFGASESSGVAALCSE